MTYCFSLRRHFYYTSLSSSAVSRNNLIRLWSFFLLGTSPWILVNGIWGEVPLLLARLDNDYTILSSITLCITLSNLAPIGWSIAADIRKRAETRVGIAAILVLGLITAVLLSTISITKTSILAISVCSGIIGTMSVVLYFPYASGGTKETTAMASGTAVANLLVGVLAIVQQTDATKARFSVSAYFGILGAIVGLSVIGFVGTMLVKPQVNEQDGVKSDKDMEKNSDEDEELTKQDEDKPTPTKLFGWGAFIDTSLHHWTLNTAQFFLNALAFVMPGLVPYSVQNFHNSQSALHYLTVSQLLSQTIGILWSGRWKPEQNNQKCRLLTIWFFLALASWIPTMVFAFENNHDDFTSKQANATIPIALNALFQLTYGYISTTLFHMIHSSSQVKEHASRVLGTWNQVGAMLGSLVAYMIVQRGWIG